MIMVVASLFAQVKDHFHLLSLSLEMANLRREMDEMIRKNQEEIENMNKSWEDKLSEQQKDVRNMGIVEGGRRMTVNLKFHNIHRSNS